MLPLKFADAVIHSSKAHGIREPHRAAAMCRKAVAIEVNDVDVHGAKRKAFFQDARALVDQGVNATVHDLLRGNLPLRDSRLGGPLAHESGHFGIGTRPPVFIVLVPARAGLLAVPTHLAQPVACNSHANSRYLQMLVLLADAPANVEPREVSDGERSHGHAPIV